MRLAVLVSGEGTNLQAILDAHAAGRVPGSTVAVVLSNKASAGGLERARRAGVPTEVVDHRRFAKRREFDAACVELLLAHDIDTVALAGFMRILTPMFLDAFPGRVLNIHPALLPSFPGLDAVGQALEQGVKVTGVTVHFVDAGVDTGPILLQEAVTLRAGDDRPALEARLHEVEHRLYPEALRLVATGRVCVEGRNARIRAETTDS